jgi:hypothetical protein
MAGSTVTARGGSSSVGAMRYQVATFAIGERSRNPQCIKLFPGRHVRCCAAGSASFQ